MLSSNLLAADHGNGAAPELVGGGVPADKRKMIAKLMTATPSPTKNTPAHENCGFERGDIDLTRHKISDRWRERARLLVECGSHRKRERGTASGSLHRLVRVHGQSITHKRRPPGCPATNDTQTIPDSAKTTRGVAMQKVESLLRNAMAQMTAATT